MTARAAIAATSAALAPACLAAALWLAATAPAPAPVAAQEGAGNPARGRIVYEANCVHCHRKDGAGGVKVTATAPPARSFATARFWRGRSDSQLHRAIAGGFPKSGMVAWKDLLKPQQIRDVVAYLRVAFQPR
jgi:mono/diheme cytochrome c family protein